MKQTDRQARLEILAYKIWEEQGRPEGRQRDHWAEAERRLRLESGAWSTFSMSDDLPHDNEETPGRLTSRQQIEPGQSTQTGSKELDKKSASPPRKRSR